MHDQIAKITKYPLGVVVAFHGDRRFSGLEFHSLGDFVPNGLDLGLVRAIADQEVVRERAQFAEVEDADIRSEFGFSRAKREEPRGAVRGGRSRNCGPGLKFSAQSMRGNVSLLGIVLH